MLLHRSLFLSSNELLEDKDYNKFRKISNRRAPSKEYHPRGVLIKTNTTLTKESSQSKHNMTCSCNFIEISCLFSTYTNSMMKYKNTIGSRLFISCQPNPWNEWINVLSYSLRVIMNAVFDFRINRNPKKMV